MFDCVLALVIQFMFAASGSKVWDVTSDRSGKSPFSFDEQSLNLRPSLGRYLATGAADSCVKVSGPQGLGVATYRLSAAVGYRRF